MAGEPPKECLMLVYIASDTELEIKCFDSKENKYIFNQKHTIRIRQEHLMTPEAFKQKWELIISESKGDIAEDIAKLVNIDAEEILPVVKQETKEQETQTKSNEDIGKDTGQQKIEEPPQAEEKKEVVISTMIQEEEQLPKTDEQSVVEDTIKKEGVQPHKADEQSVSQEDPTITATQELEQEQEQKPEPEQEQILAQKQEQVQVQEQEVVPPQNLFEPNSPKKSEDNDMDGSPFRMTPKTWISASVVSLIICAGFFFSNRSKAEFRKATIGTSTWNIGARDPKVLSTSLPMPDGVNIGSWLSLEDYFFAGNSAIEVATPDDRTAAVCLPPLHTGASTGPAWHAETDLLENLAAETTLGHALRVFHAHRNSFLDFEEDLEVLKQLGVHSIRVPLSWCLTDEDPATIDPKDTDVADLEQRFTCEDPFFEGVLWPASKFRFVPSWEACGCATGC
jgi:hypothetical protein